MPEIFDHVAYLSQQIGPRPAGTEEEQQAALYITEQLQKDAGLPAVIEDFNSAGGADLPRALCCGATVVAGIAAMIAPVAFIPSIVVSLIALLLFAAEAFGKPILSRALARGVSQNVVARYEPGYTAEGGGTRRRKIVLVARYDSGKVRTDLKSPFIAILPILRWVHLGALVFVPLFVVIRMAAFSQAEGITAIVLNVLLGLALVLAALPVFAAISRKLSAYNEAANCNASGVAVLLEVARRIGRGRVSEAELAARSEEAVIHGEAAARSQGLVPEGVELVYAANNVKAPEPVPQSEAARLATAKAAIAALTGKPVSGSFSSDISEHLVQVKEPPLPSASDEDYHALRNETREAFLTIPPETVQQALLNSELSGQENQGNEGAEGASGVVNPSVIPVSEPIALNKGFSSASSADGVPDWFRKAQEKAKKPMQDAGEVQRSRYAAALDAAMSDESDEANEASEGEIATMADRLQSMREGIMDVKAPQWQRATEEEIPVHDSVSADQDSTPSEAEAMAASLGMAEQAPAAGSTTAMPPIDVSALRLGEMPAMNDIAMPSFLDPSKIQAEKLNERGEIVRTENRIDVSSNGADMLAGYPDAMLPQDAAALESEAAQRRPISLPDIGVSTMTPLKELSKQRAPLAEAESSGKNAAKSLLTLLPAIDPAQPLGGESSRCDSEQGEFAPQRAELRTALPSLSGSITRQEDAAVSAVGSFIPAGATGSIAPIGDELLENVDPDDIYVDDADDSAYYEEHTETGAFAGTGYVEMPKSRTRRFFDRFRRNKDEEVGVGGSTQEWLDVDDQFDARAVGAERGSWESFREEGSEEDEFIADDYEVDANDRPLAYASSTEAFDIDDVDEYGNDAFASNRTRWNGGAFSRQRVGHAGELLAEEQEAGVEAIAAAQEIADVNPELKQIYQFRNPDINTEVWFVALGSELVQHGGMQAFLAEHHQDLHGSIIIDIEALGVGDLCMIESEGSYRKVKASSRMKRYTKKASQATGVSIGTGSILWSDSSASFAIKQGFQAMHLAGMDGLKPAFFAQGDDVLENIDGQTLEANADFVMELLKNI